MSVKSKLDKLIEAARAVNIHMADVKMDGGHCFKQTGHAQNLAQAFKEYDASPRRNTSPRPAPHRSPTRDAEGGGRTCVQCGCTDSRACPGGCHWVIQHTATPTGICSACFYSGPVRLGDFIVSKTNMPHGKVWLQHRDGEGMQTDEAKLAAHLLVYFNREF